jgi:hypothetical protein
MRITVRRGAEYHQGANWYADEMAREVRFESAVPQPRHLLFSAARSLHAEREPPVVMAP